MKKERKKATYIIKKVFSLVFKNSPVLCILEIILLFIYSLYGTMIIYSTSYLFNIVQSNRQLNDEILKAILLLIFVLITKEVVSAITDYFSQYICESSLTKFSKLLHEKADKIETITYENPAFLDLIEKAEDGAYVVAYFVINILGLFFYDFPYLIVIGLYLMQIKSILFIIPFCIFIPAILTQFIKTRYNIRYKNEEAPLQRKKESYRSYICDVQYFKESRHLGCFKYFLSRYIYISELLINKIWKLKNKEQLVDILNKIITLSGYVTATFMLYFSLIDASISISIFATVFYSLNNVHSNIEHILSNRIGPIIVDDYSSIASFLEFLELPDRKFGEKSCESIVDIEFRNVSFSYPGYTEQAVSNINLKINKGQLVAIVGENGSGKSTLAKLLLGIYVPQHGKIYLNGVDVSNISRESIFKHKSAVFQNFYKYYFNLADNISISDYDIVNDMDRLNLITKNMNINVDSKIFPEGYRTILSRNFGGVDLSGGEWQKVAIARGYYREHDILVLDEPMAMIDPIQEEYMYRNIVDHSKDKTVVVVTHRMAIVKEADVVIYMKNGKIEQIGKHDELLNNKSYRHHFLSQAKWYQ